MLQHAICSLVKCKMQVRVTAAAVWCAILNPHSTSTLKDEILKISCVCNNFFQFAEIFCWLFPNHFQMRFSFNIHGMLYGLYVYQWKIMKIFTKLFPLSPSLAAYTEKKLQNKLFHSPATLGKNQRGEKKNRSQSASNNKQLNSSHKKHLLLFSSLLCLLPFCQDDICCILIMITAQ